MSEQEQVEESSMTVKSNLSSFYKTLSSYNSNVLLVALVFLLLVVLFVLLLHFYARFFWSHSSDQEFSRRHRRRRRNRRRTVTTTRIIPSVPLDGGVVPSSSSSSAAATNDDKGLDSSVISSIPLFVYEEEEKDEEEEKEEECVICLGLWEVGDFGRKLRNCGHGFHVECIDMWLSSHSTCPLCRSPVLAVSDQENLKPAFNEEEDQETETRLQLFPSGEDENISGDRRLSPEGDLKTGVDGGDGDGEGEVRIDIIAGEESEINDGGYGRKSSSSSSLRRMLISSSSSRSRSERNKVFPSTTQDSTSFS